MQKPQPSTVNVYVPAALRVPLAEAARWSGKTRPKYMLALVEADIAARAKKVAK